MNPINSKEVHRNLQLNFFVHNPAHNHLTNDHFLQRYQVLSYTMDTPFYSETTPPGKCDGKNDHNVGAEVQLNHHCLPLHLGVLNYVFRSQRRKVHKICSIRLFFYRRT